MINYFTNKIIGTFEDVTEKVKHALKTEGFGIISEIDMHSTFKQKINKDFRKYKILGACNPEFAFKALTLEDKVGTMMPCNIIVQEIAHDTIEVAAINPEVGMEILANLELSVLAHDVSQKIKKVITQL